jgi:hypothetical protein
MRVDIKAIDINRLEIPEFLYKIKNDQVSKSY